MYRRVKKHTVINENTRLTGVQINVIPMKFLPNVAELFSDKPSEKLNN